MTLMLNSTLCVGPNVLAATIENKIDIVNLLSHVETCQWLFKKQLM